MKANRASIGLIKKTCFYYTTRFKKIWFIPTLSWIVGVFVSQFILSIVKNFKHSFRGLDAVMSGLLSPEIFIKHNLMPLFVLLICFLSIKYATDVFFDFFTHWQIKSDGRPSDIGRRWRSIFAVKLVLLMAQIMVTVGILTLSTVLEEINRKWFLGLLSLVLFYLTILSQLTVPEIVFKYTRAFTAIKNSITLFRRHPVLTQFILLTALIPSIFASIPASKNALFKFISLILAPLFYTAVYSLWERDKLEAEYEKKMQNKQVKDTARKKSKQKPKK